MPDPFGSFFQQASALHSSPRAQSCISRMYEAKRCETIQRRIDPAVHRHVWRTHVLWVTRFRLRGRFKKISPCGSTEFWVMTRPIDLTSEVPAQYASNENV